MRVRQKGVVLPLTLIVLAILTMMASLLLGRSEQFIDDARYTKRMMEARLKIQSAEQRVLMAIMAGQQDPGAYVLGQVQLRTDGASVKLSSGVWVSIQDRTGLLGLRFFRVDLLQSLLRSYLGGEKGIEAVNNIIRFQAMNDPTPDLPLDYSPRQALFRSLDELMLIPNISPDIYNGNYNLNLDDASLRKGIERSEYGLRDLLSMSGSSSINYPAIPEFLLRRVFKLDDRSIEELNSMKDRADWNGVAKKFQRLGWYGAADSYPSSFYRIRFQYDGIQARGDYQVRSTTIPPIRREWIFPDKYRYFVQPNITLSN